MTLRPFFPYYGAKYRYGKDYPTPLGGKIIEPFAGAAGYATRHGSTRQVNLYDVDERVVGVWRYLISETVEGIRSIPDVPNEGSVDDMPICQEARWLVGYWCRRSSARPARHPSAWMRSGLYPGSFWGARVRERIARQVEHIRHWRVQHLTYDEVPNEYASWFIDPPYQVCGVHYTHGSGGIDYKTLSEWCRSRDGQVIVCEQSGATWLPFRTLRSIATTSSKRSLECVWEGASR